jgi:hypothetical protein
MHRLPSMRLSPCGTCGGALPAASIDQVYVTCARCGRVAVAGLSPGSAPHHAHVITGYALFVGLLMLAGVVLVLLAAA